MNIELQIDPGAPWIGFSGPIAAAKRRIFPKTLLADAALIALNRVSQPFVMGIFFGGNMRSVARHMAPDRERLQEIWSGCSAIPPRQEETE